MSAEKHRPVFDVVGFDAALRDFAQMQGKDMKQVAAATGVSETTISRMHNHGRAPDAASLAALGSWAGINPARFCSEAPTARMQPRDETARRMEFERAKRLVESHGWTVTAPESVGCESIGLRA
jgi:transcriptional regulator with XRE-family HTH domain